MTTFKQFLSEDILSEDVVKKWFTASMEVKDAINFLNQHAKSGLLAIKNGGLVYRGFKDLKDAKTGMTVIDSASGYRTSRDTDNMYQLMMSVSPSLKSIGIHDRHTSLICSTSKYTALGYGSLKVVVPLDGSTVSYHEYADDIFSHTIKTPFYRGDVNSMDGISTFLRKCGVQKDKGNFTDAKEIDSVLAKIDPVVLCLMYDQYVLDDGVGFLDREIDDEFEGLNTSSPDMVKNSAFPKIREQFLKLRYTHGGIPAKKSTLNVLFDTFVKNQKRRFTALAGLIMTPKTLSVKSVPYGSKLPEDVECWYSGKAVLISKNLFAEILVELQKNKFPINKSILDQWDGNMDDYR